MTTLEAGDPAPPFELLDQESNRVSLSDFAGRKLLVYFYPKADTPVARNSHARSVMRCRT